MNLYSQQAELLDPTNQGIKDAILKTTKEEVACRLKWVFLNCLTQNNVNWT
jgi:hypothetical protein